MTIKLPLPADLGHYEALVCMWIGSDPGLLEQMRLLTRSEDYNYVGDETLVLDLASTVLDMLYSSEYNPANGRPVPDLLKVTQNCGDAGKAATFRASVSRRAMYDIELDGWAHIRDALLADVPRETSNDQGEN